MDQHTTAEIRALYWQRVKRLTAQCLAAWFFPTFLVIFFARELATVTVLGWPLSFYMAAQGLTLSYVLIVAYYAIAMHEFDKILKGGMHDD